MPTHNITGAALLLDKLQTERTALEIRETKAAGLCLGLMVRDLAPGAATVQMSDSDQGPYLWIDNISTAQGTVLHEDDEVTDEVSHLPSWFRDDLKSVWNAFVTDNGDGTYTLDVAKACEVDPS